MNRRLTVTGLTEEQRALSSMSEKIEDLRWFWIQLQSVIAEKQQAHFATGGSGTWKPLSNLYAAQKERTHPGKPLMQLSGDLKNALTTVGSRGNLWNSQPDSVEFGALLPYVLAHHFGYPARNLPARSLISPDLASGVALIESLSGELADYARSLNLQVTTAFDYV